MKDSAKKGTLPTEGALFLYATPMHKAAVALDSEVISARLPVGIHESRSYFVNCQCALYSTFRLGAKSFASCRRKSSIAAHVTGKLSRKAVCHAYGTMQRRAFGIIRSASIMVAMGAWSSSSPAIKSTGQRIAPKSSAPTSVWLQKSV